MKTRILKVVIQSLIVVVGMSSVAWAQASKSQHKMDRKVVLACQKTLGISSSATPTTDQVPKIRDCVKQYRTNLHNCAMQAGLPLAGGSMSGAQVSTYRACHKQAYDSIH